MQALSKAMIYAGPRTMFIWLLPSSLVLSFTGFTSGLVNNRTVLLPIPVITATSPSYLNPTGRTWERVLSLTHQPNAIWVSRAGEGAEEAEEVRRRLQSRFVLFSHVLKFLPLSHCVLSCLQERLATEKAERAKAQGAAATAAAAVH
jgi:hypothetical protein